MKQLPLLPPIHCLVFLFFAALLSSPLIAQEPDKKTMRYHAALLERPDSDTLFSRFFDSWLESHTIEDLKKFLSNPQKKSVPDAMILGRFYLRQGDDQKAGAVLRKAIAHPRASGQQKANALVALSEVLTRDMDFSEALTQIKVAQNTVKTAEISDPDLAKNLAKREGNLLLRLDRRREGLLVWKNLLKQHPKDRFLHEDVVSLLADEGLFDEAITEQMALIERIESGKDAYAAVLAKVELGQIHRRANNWREATKVWQSALPTTGNDTWVEREILGLIEASFRRSDDLRGLRKAIEQMIDAEPKRLSLQIAQARLFADLREDAAAMKQWQHILELTPGNNELRLQYIQTLADLDRPADAAEQLKNLIAAEPNDPELLFQLAELQYEAEQNEANGKSLLAFLEKSDGSEYSHLRVARKLARFELPIEAKSVFEKLVTKFPESTGASDAFAMYLYDTDKKTAAINRWKSLAAGGDAIQVLQVARQLSQRFESKEAYQLLEQRLPDFETNFRYLGEFCQAAIVEKKAGTAFPIALKAVDVSSTATDLDAAIKMALKVAARLEGGIDEAITKVADPTTINAKCLHASLLVAQGNYQDAVKNLEALASVGESESALFPLLTLKQIHRGQNAWTDAAETMEQIITNIPGGRKSGHIEELITLYERALRPVPALRWTREWKQIAPGNYQPWIRESEMLEKAGRISEALQVIQDAGRRFERETTIQIRLADMYSEAGYPREAERVLWKLYENTEDEWARQSWITELARIALKNGRIEFIIKELQERRRNNSQSLTPILSLAEVYRIANKDREYRETLLAAATLEPDSIHLAHRIVDLDLKQGNYSAAQALLEKIKAKDRTGRTINRIARLHMMTGNLTQALQIISELQSGKKPSGSEIKSMGLTAMTVGEWQAAAEFLFPRLIDHPDDVGMHYMHAIARLEAGNEEGARAALLSLFSFPVKNPPPAVPNPNQAYQFLQLPQGLPEHKTAKWIQFFGGAENYRKQHNYLTDFNGLLYQLRHDSNRGGNNPLPIPINEMQLRAFALSHLLRLPDVDLKDPSFRAEAIAAGLPPKEFDLAGTQRIKDPKKRFSEVKRLYNTYKDDSEFSLWFVGQYNSANTTEESDAALLGQAYKTIAKTHGPETTALLAFRYSHAIQGALYVDQIGKISSRIIPYLVDGMDSFPADQQKSIQQKLEAWQPGETPDSINYQAINSLLNYFIVKGKEKQWIAFVRKQWKRGELSQLTGQNAYQSFRYRDGSANALKLPSIIPGVSRVIYSNLQQSSIYKNKAAFPIANHFEDFVDEPTLYFVLAAVARNTAHQEKALAILEKRAAQPDVSISELYLLGFKLAVGDSDAQIPSRNNLPSEPVNKAQLTRGITYLEQTRKLSPDSVLGSMVDFQILQAAARVETSPSIRKAGIEAALRLRLDKNLPQWEWDNIADKLASWGHPEKAKRPSQIVSASQRATFRSRSGYNYGRGNPISSAAYVVIPSTNQLNKEAQRLIGKKNSDAAVRLLSQQLPMQAGRILTLNGENEKKNQFRNLKQTFEKAKLVDRVIVASKPGPEARHLDRARFAAIYDLFGRNETAIGAYRELLKEQPGHPVLRLRLVHCLADSDTQAAIDELMKIAGQDGEILNNQFVATALQSIAQKNPRDFSDKIKMAEAFHRFLEPITPTETVATTQTQFFQGPQAVMSMLAGAGYEGKTAIPAMMPNRGGGFGFEGGDPFGGTSARASKASDSANVQEIVKKRYEAYKDLALRIIQLDKRNQAHYFSQLAGAAAVSKDDTSFLLPICWEVIEEMTKEHLVSSSPPQQYVNIRRSYGQWSNYGITISNYGTPIGFYNQSQSQVSAPIPWLINYSFQSKSPQLVEELIAKMQSKNRDNEINSIQTTSNLYFCSPESFTDAARKALQLNAQLPDADSKTILVAPKPGRIQAGLGPQSWGYISHVRKHRPEVEPHFDTVSLSIEFLRKKGTQAPLMMFPQVAREIVAEQGPDACRNYFKDIEKALFDDENARDFVSKNPGDPKAHFYINTFNQMARDRICCYPTIRYAMESGLGKIKNFQAQSTLYLAGYNTDLGNPDLLQFLTYSGLLWDLDQYETFPRSEFPSWQDRECNSFASRFLRNLRDRHQSSNRKERRAELLEHIATLSEEPTFGRRLLEVMLSDKSPEATVELFNEKIVEIQNLPESQQIKIAQLGRDLMNFNSFTRRLTSDERDTIRWIGRQSGKGAVDQLTQLLEAKTFYEIGATIRRGGLQWSGQQTIRSGLPFDWKKSFQAFENVCVLGEEAIQSGLLTPQSSTFTDGLLHPVHNDNLAVESFAFCLSVANSKKLPSCYRYPDVVDELAKQINKSNTTVLGEFFNDVQGQVELESMDTRIAIPLLYELVRSLNSNSRKAVHEWAQGDGTKLLYPILSEHLRAVNSIFFDRDKPLPEEVKAHFETALTKQSDQDLGPRLIIAEMLCDDLSNPPASIATIVKLSLEALLEGWKRNEPIPQNFASEILASHHSHANSGRVDWEDLELALGNEFHRRFVSEEIPVSEGRPRALIQASNFDRNFLKRMIALQARQKNYAAANQILTKYRKNLESELSNIFAIMVRFGGHEIASRVLRTNWKQCLDRQIYEFKYDETQAKGLAAYVSSLEKEEPWMPILAELIIISMSDPPGSDPKPEGWIRQSERQIALAERFKIEDFPLREMRDGAINVLSRNSEAKKILAPLFAEIAKDWNIPIIASELDSRSRKKKAQIYCDYLVSELRKGKTDKWKRSLADAKVISDQSIRRDLIRSITATLSSNWSVTGLTPEALGTIPPLIYQSLGEEEYQFSRTNLTKLIVLHYLSKTEEEIPNYISKLDKKAWAKFYPVYQRDLQAAIDSSFREIKDPKVHIKLIEDISGKKFTKKNFRGKEMPPEMFWRVSRPMPVKGPLDLTPFIYTKFVSAKSISDSGIEAKYFRKEGLKVLLGASALQEKRTIYDHTISLIRSEQHSKEGWKTSYWNGWSPAGKLLTEFGSQATKDNWKPLALIADVVWNNPPLDFTYAHCHEYGEQARFDSILERSAGLFRPRETLQEQIDILSKEQGDRSDWGPPSVFLPQFYESYDAIGNPTHIIDYVEAADAIWEDTKNPLALEFAMAGRMWLEKYHHEYFGPKKLSRPQAWKAHALTALNDPRANLALRLSLARHFLYRARGKCSDELIWAASRIVAEGLNSEQYVNGYTLAVVLRAFNQLSVESEWKDIANKMVSGWHHKCRLDGEETKHGRAFQPVTDAVLAILETILILGDETEIEKILQEKDERLKDSPRVFALLVRHGQFESARKFSEFKFKTWDVAEMTGRFDVRYDRQLHEQIPKYIETLTNEEHKYFANLFLYSIPDPLPEDDHWYQLHPELRNRLGIDLLPNKVERLAPYAKKAQGIEFFSEGNERRALLLLSRDWRIAPHFDSLLESEFKNRDGSFHLIAEKGKNSAMIDPDLMPSLVFSVNRVLEGDPIWFKKLVDQIANSKKSKTTWARTFSLERCVRDLNDMVEERLLSMNDQQIEATFQAYCDLYSQLGVSTTYDQYGEGMFIQIIVSALLKDETALAKWRERNEKKIQILKTIMSSKKITAPHVVSSMLHLEGHEKSAVTEEKQWAVARTLIADPWLQEAYKDSHSTPMILHLLQHHCVTPSQVKEYEKQIAATWTQNGLVSLEVAQFYARQQNPEKAKEFARLALQQIGAEASRGRKTEMRVKAAALLRRFGDMEFVTEMLLDPKVEYSSMNGILQLSRELKKQFKLPVNR